MNLCGTKMGRYQAIGRHNIGKLPEWAALDPDLREAIQVVAQVLPFRANRYVVENLINWSKVPDDPIFRLIFPQREMLDADEFGEVKQCLRENDSEALARTVRRIRLALNPHPDGQLTHNVPIVAGRPLWGLQHKYRETVLFFPFQGQTCHSYCTYCFRWAQFVDMDGLKFARKDATDLVAYLKVHPEVTDVLVTGGDPMVMRAPVLRKYIEPLLDPALEHVQTIRIGTKAVASWPYRFVSDDDADDCLRLFEQIVAAGRHLAVMGHYSHPAELAPEIAREAIRRIRATGAQIRMQTPLIRHVNDNPEAWAALWRTGVRLGLVPYYMFVERDTGARKYFEVPLVRALDVHRQAQARVSGLGRTAQGPSMSAFPGKVRILGSVTLRSLLDDCAAAALAALPARAGAADPDTPMLICDFLQARDPAFDRTLFVAACDPDATWLDHLRPVGRQDRFPFDCWTDNGRSHRLQSETECLLH
ncbi:L-lysine 2,3-aminomutase [Bradyrhizobium japonicum]